MYFVVWLVGCSRTSVNGISIRAGISGTGKFSAIRSTPSNAGRSPAVVNVVAVLLGDILRLLTIGILKDLGGSLVRKTSTIPIAADLLKVVVQFKILLKTE